MTGWYPHVRGHRTMFHMLRPDEPCLLKSLKDAGYFVWWGGKNDLVPAQNGYGAYCDIKYAPPEPPRPMFAMDRAEEWRGEPGSDTYYSFQAGRLDTGDEEIYRDGDWACRPGSGRTRCGTTRRRCAPTRRAPASGRRDCRGAPSRRRATGRG
jgi:hypothetical protein